MFGYHPRHPPNMASTDHALELIADALGRSRTPRKHPASRHVGDKSSTLNFTLMIRWSSTIRHATARLFLKVARRSGTPSERPIWAQDLQKQKSRVRIECIFDHYGANQAKIFLNIITSMRCRSLSSQPTSQEKSFRSADFIDTLPAIR
jgi:hypothetical protein